MIKMRMSKGEQIKDLKSKILKYLGEGEGSPRKGYEVGLSNAKPCGKPCG